MDVLTTVIALIIAISVKVLVFFLFARYSQKDAPRQEITYKVVQTSRKEDTDGKKRVMVTGGAGWLGRYGRSRVMGRMLMVINFPGAAPAMCPVGAAARNGRTGIESAPLRRSSD